MTATGPGISRKDFDGAPRQPHIAVESAFEFQQ